jgi:hypothetical protein
MTYLVVHLILKQLCLTSSSLMICGGGIETKQRSSLEIAL